VTGSGPHGSCWRAVPWRPCFNGWNGLSEPAAVGGIGARVVAGLVCVSDEPAAQPEAEQRPDLRDRVLAGDLAAQIGVEIFLAGAGRLARDGEAVAQDQDAEGEQAERLVVLGWHTVVAERTGAA